MSDRDERGSGSTLAIVSGVVLLLLALPCLAVVVLFGIRLLHVVGYEPPPPVVQPAPPVVVQPVEVVPVPVKPAAPAAPEGK